MDRTEVKEFYTGKKILSALGDNGINSLEITWGAIDNNRSELVGEITLKGSSIKRAGSYISQKAGQISSKIT